MVEKMVVKEGVHAAQTAGKLVETMVWKAWSILDAASEKNLPSQVLSEKAVHSIQGNSQS